MKEKLLGSIFLLALCNFPSFAHDGTILLNPTPRVSAVWFVPNQIKGNVWYKPNGNYVNGHIEGSFSNLDLWPKLIQNLIPNSGGLGIYASEIGYTTDKTLEKLRQSRLAVSVEEPSWTQCKDGRELAELAINGKSPGSSNLFNDIFGISPSYEDRTDPNGRGWFTTLDGSSYAPEEIILDERLPNLLPYYNSTADLFNQNLTWEQRKKSLHDDCPQSSSFNPSVDRITGFIQDYVEYARVLKLKFPATDLSLHWNVNPGWEWRDSACLEKINARYPNANDFKNIYTSLSEPCHNDTEYLIRTVQALCADGKCPKAVFMDMDYLYNTSYTLNVLRRNKEALRVLGIDFGLNIINQCDSTEGGNSAVNKSIDNNNLVCVKRIGAPPNQINEESLLNVVDFLITNKIIDASTRLRIGSWSGSPIESGLHVNEDIGASFASTTNRIFSEFLTPLKFVNPPSPSFNPRSGIIQPEGLFQVGNSGIYISNGKNAYCGIPNWQNYLKLGGRTDMSNVAHPTSLPNGMRFDPICHIPQPAGFFQLNNSGIYFSNGSDAYCGISSLEVFISMGGLADLSNVTEVETLPPSMRQDPICN